MDFVDTELCSQELNFKNLHLKTLQVASIVSVINDRKNTDSDYLPLAPEF